MTATLHLPLKGEYFDQIAAGEKTEEYRRATAYWRTRLENRSYDQIVLTRGYPPAGDPARTLTLPWRGCRLVTIIHPHFGPEPVEVYSITVMRQNEALARRAEAAPLMADPISQSLARALRGE